jgi:hypothetical protein
LNIDTRLQLLVPGLLSEPASDAGDAPKLAALETLFARAQATALPRRGFEALLFSLLGAEIPDEGDLPVAAVTRVLDLGIVDNGWWLRADPVNLNPQRDQLILSDNHLLDLTQDEANRIAADITELYAPDGWSVKAPRPSRWYIKPARAPKVTTTPLADVVARDIHPYLPRGAEAKAWHTILNETQILLHSSKVNEQRERAGKLPVNSLWFWGGGRLPRIQPVGWGGLWSSEPVSLGLARLTETQAHSVPRNFSDWQRQAGAAGAHLIVLDALRAPLQYRDAEAWAKTMEELERNWFAPLLDALKSRAVESAALLTDTGQSFRLTSRLARRWWRLRKPLSLYR